MVVVFIQVRCHAGSAYPHHLAYVLGEEEADGDEGEEGAHEAKGTRERGVAVADVAEERRSGVGSGLLVLLRWLLRLRGGAARFG